jgi:SPP1 gp7 family putative phage head morphogenesis protein
MAGEVDPFGLPNEEAIRFFRQKGYRLGWDWTETQKQEHAKAFTVAKATQLDLLADIRAAVDTAIAGGQTLRTFKTGLTPLLQEKGWWGEKTAVNPNTGKEETVQLGSPRRLQTIYETNLRTSRAAGQWERIQRVKEARPYLRYVAMPDAREEHRAWHDTVLPVDDPWWSTHMPPNGWGCRCKVQQLSSSELERYGFAVSNRPTAVEDKTGIGKGWDYNPGDFERSWEPGQKSYAMPLDPVKRWQDEKRPSAKELAATARPMPTLWAFGTDEARDPARIEAAWRQLFGGMSGAQADPLGDKVVFDQKLFNYQLNKDRDPTRINFVPSAKDTVANPTEIWLVPFRRRDGRVVMHTRYLGIYADRQQLVEVERDELGNIAYNTFPARSLDGKREGYLLYPK